MITFILLAVFAIIGIAAWIVAYTANSRKRARQSGQAEVTSQQNRDGQATVGRPTGVN